MEEQARIEAEFNDRLAADAALAEEKRLAEEKSLAEDKHRRDAQPRPFFSFIVFLAWGTGYLHDLGEIWARFDLDMQTTQ